MKKKLIEVALPLEAINQASIREKSIRHGHPSTLHLWWARRPLATCRAVLFAQLVDDPSSHPELFPTEVEQNKERERLFSIIKDLVKWENSTNEGVLKKAHDEIVKSCGEVPTIYDPFSGGCSIPLEAQRLGLPAYGSDLNPVAVMIGKAMIEIPWLFKERAPIHPIGPEQTDYRYAEGLAEDVKYYGEWMRKKAFERIGHLYPQVDLPQQLGGGKATVIAWIWARTVPSPDPAFADVQVPLIRSFDLSTKKGHEVWLEPVIEGKNYHFEIKSKANGDVRHELSGTVNRQGGVCLVSGSAMSFAYIREMAKKGHMSQTLLAIVVEGQSGRLYLPPSDNLAKIANTHETNELASEYREGFLSGETPARLTGGTCHSYGLDQWGKLFTNRQLVALNTFSDLVKEARAEIEQDALKAGVNNDPTPLRDGGLGAKAYAEAVSVYLAFIVDKCADYWSSICSWNSPGEKMRNTFGRQAIPMVWDFAETNIFSHSTGNWTAMNDWAWKAVKAFIPFNKGVERQRDAQTVDYPPLTVISTDPPYYDNIGYADLSDFFYVWLRGNLRDVYPKIFGVLSTPKIDELVATPYRHGGRDQAQKFFLNGMREVLSNMAEQASPDFPATIYYAFKQSEVSQEGIASTGWATFLQAVMDAGYNITGTWPMRTEMANRMVAAGTNALANSVVLVCRKRADTAKVIMRGEFIRALEHELPEALQELQAAHIAPADMPQSAIGPGMAIFSRYKAVLETDDTPMSVKTALQIINQKLDEYFTEVQGEFDTETRFAINWYHQFGMGKGEFGIANSLAQARGISVDQVKHAGLIESVAGNVRLLQRNELDENWSPDTDKHLTIWECCQYLIRLHEEEGVSQNTARLLKEIGAHADDVRNLAYCLYDLAANKRQDAKEALAYNALISDWAELTKLVATLRDELPYKQMKLNV